MAHAPYLAHWMLRSDALHSFDNQKVVNAYSSILLILFFLHVLSSKDNLAFYRKSSKMILETERYCA